MNTTLLTGGIAALLCCPLIAQAPGEVSLDPTDTRVQGVTGLRGVCGSGQTDTIAWMGNVGQAGNMIDITVGASDMTIECLDVHVSGATPTDIEVWWCATSVIGNETNPAAWTLVGGQTGITPLGTGFPTPVDIAGNGVVFSAGQTYGLYIVNANFGAGGATMWYTSGTTGYYTGDHCDIQTQHGSQVNWGGIFTPREWNGILYTDVAGPAGPTLSVVGQCGQPGSGVQATNMTPNSLCGFAASPSNAGISVPAGPCGQVALGLGQPLFVVGFANADGNGTATVLPGNGIPSVACGWNMQSIDLSSCALTNVVVL